MAWNRLPRATVGVRGWASWGFSIYSSVMPTPHPSLGLSFPTCTEQGLVPNLSGSRAGAYADPTPPCRQLGPRSPGSCAGWHEPGGVPRPPAR